MAKTLISRNEFDLAYEKIFEQLNALPLDDQKWERLNLETQAGGTAQILRSDRAWLSLLAIIADSPSTGQSFNLESAISRIENVNKDPSFEFSIRRGLGLNRFESDLLVGLAERLIAADRLAEADDLLSIVVRRKDSVFSHAQEQLLQLAASKKVPYLNQPSPTQSQEPTPSDIWFQRLISEQGVAETWNRLGVEIDRQQANELESASYSWADSLVRATRISDAAFEWGVQLQARQNQITLTDSNHQSIGSFQFDAIKSSSADDDTDYLPGVSYYTVSNLVAKGRRVAVQVNSHLFLIDTYRKNDTNPTVCWSTAGNRIRPTQIELEGPHETWNQGALNEYQYAPSICLTEQGELIVLEHGQLTCRDASNGATLWTRFGCDNDSHLLSQGEEVALFKPDQSLVAIFSTRDGSLLRRDTISDSAFWKVINDRLLMFRRTRDTQVLQMLDPFTFQIQWEKSLPAGTLATIYDDLAVLAVEPNGTVSWIDLATGSFAWSNKMLEDNFAANSIRLHRQGGVLILELVQEAISDFSFRFHETYIEPYWPEYVSPLRSGYLIAFKPDTGEALWPKPIRNDGAVVFQLLPGDSVSGSGKALSLDNYERGARYSKYQFMLIDVHNGCEFARHEFEDMDTQTIQMGFDPERQIISLQVMHEVFVVKAANASLPPRPLAQLTISGWLPDQTNWVQKPTGMKETKFDLEAAKKILNDEQNRLKNERQQFQQLLDESTDASNGNDN
ncbi:MAG: PQQ-binding-like beta-propeller repeat protein [Pirellulaceae bacterium]